MNIQQESLQNLKILQSCLPYGVNPKLEEELKKEIEKREAAERMRLAANLAIERQLMNQN